MARLPDSYGGGCVRLCCRACRGLFDVRDSLDVISRRGACYRKKNSANLARLPTNDQKWELDPTTTAALLPLLLRHTYGKHEVMMGSSTIILRVWRHIVGTRG